MSLSLNIGSSTTIRGVYSNDNWVNIDLVVPNGRTKGKYVAGDSLNLPFRENTFEEIRAIHCLEHIDRKNHKKFYEESHRVLKKGFPLFIEVPNFYLTCKILVQSFEGHSKNRAEHLRIETLSVYGKGRHKGDYHRWGFYPELLVNDLSEYFSEVSIEEEMISQHHIYEPVILVKAIK